MPEKILFVDDEQNVLSAFQRMLRGDYEVSVASGADEAFAKIDSASPFSVVVCDMRMPGLNGVDTLKRFARDSAETVRIMLSGNADQETAVRAINEGSIFRYITKPCPEELLRSTLKAAVRQHELVVAEKTLLEKTLLGSVRVLMDVLSIAQPEAFGRAARARNWVKPLIKGLNARNIGDNSLNQRSVWEIQIASLLWPIGLISVPPEVVARAESDPESLSETEREILARAPETAGRLIAHIPRLQNVTSMIQCQDRGFDGSGFPVDGPVGLAIPEGARILRFLKDLSLAGNAEIPDNAMLSTVLQQASVYDPAIVAAAQILWGGEPAVAEGDGRTQHSLSLSALMAGDRLLSDITVDNGKLLLGAGLQINAAQIERLRNLAKLQKIKEPILIER